MEKMNELPKRKQIRLKDYDYSQNGYYFITICTKDRKPIFWQGVGADIIRPKIGTQKNHTCVAFRRNLSEYGKIADTAINAIPVYYPNMKIDKYVIMPDHIHLILIISNNNHYNNGRIISAPTVMTVIGQMKRWVSKKIGNSIWQKSYYEHIIRDEFDYIEKAEYIINNPLKWEIIKNP